MKSFRMFSLFVVLAMLFNLAIVPAVQAAPIVPDLTKVDAKLLPLLEAGDTEFYVILKEQADLSGAATLKTKLEKNTFVFNQLHDLATRTQQPLIDYIKAQHLKYRPWYILNMISVTAGMTEVEWFTSRPEVAQIVPPTNTKLEPFVNSSYSLLEPTVGIEWNVSRVKAPQAWALGADGTGMVVGDNDTGVEYTHPALVNKYRGNLGGGNFNHNYNWWDAWGGGSQIPTDYDGHGTHTMGTMVGDDGAGNQVGVAPGAQWIACAGLNLECLEFFLAPWDLNGNNPDPSKAPDSVNNSWYDTSGFDFRPIIQAMNAAGIAVIKSAGNWGAGCDTISPPGNVPEIISTAAFDSSDVIADFSSRGPSDDYIGTILKPEVAAPGVNVRSSYPGSGYTLMSGTSMAAPHSTGMVAVIWSAAPCLQGDVPTTKQIMMDTAEAKVDAQCGPFVDHPNDVWGWGVLDFEAAVTYAMGYCGGLGGIEGTVTSGAAPLEGVTVQAEGSGGFSRTDVTDFEGFYSVAVLEDTYTVTASKYGYETIVVPDVQVVSEITTTVDIEMPAVAEYTVSGYVRELGTNLPLEGTIEVLGAPIPPVTSDPATGFYSIVVAAGTWDFQVTAADHAPSTVTVVVDGDVEQDFHLSPFCDVFADDMENGPNGWTTGGSPNTWAQVTSQSHSPTHSWTDSPSGNYPDNADNWMMSPVLDLSGYTGISLSFWHRYNTESGYDYANVEYSTDGGVTWHNVERYDGTLNSWTEQQFDIPELDGAAEAAIRFHLTSDYSYNYDGWYVDDVTLIGGGPGCIGDLPPEAEFDFDNPVNLGEPAIFTNLTGGSEPLTYLWDFGDGTGTSTEVNPSYTYAAVGAYTVTLTATNNFGTDDVQHVVDVVCDAPADLGILINPADPVDGEIVTFTGTVGVGTEPLEYSWDFGDGITATGEIVEHVFADPGTYTVTLNVENPCGSDTTQTVLEVLGTPEIVVTAPPLEVVLGSGLSATLPVTICNEGSAVLDWLMTVTPTDTTWLSADPSAGSLEPDACSFVDVTFDATGLVEGDYLADLNIESNDLDEPVITLPASLSVFCEPLGGVDFTWMPDNPRAEAEVLFETTWITGTVPAVTWEFGDGETGTGVNATHIYTATGDYTVTMTAENECTEVSVVVEKVITIAEPCEAPAGVEITLPDEVFAGVEAAFEGSVVTGTEPFTFDWLISDAFTATPDITGTGQAFAYTFEALGTYTVTLTVTNECGTSTVAATFTVVPPVYKAFLPVVLKATEP